MTNDGIVTSTPTEFVDLMPTLVDAAMPDVELPACPSDAKEARNVQLCTHGVSMLPLITAPTHALKPAAYSQYPRGYQKPAAVNGEEEKEEEKEEEVMVTSLADGAVHGVSASACLTKPCTMGYSMLTFMNNVEYRYTEVSIKFFSFIFLFIFKFSFFF